jgi:hypothetical protein
MPKVAIKKNQLLVAEDDEENRRSARLHVPAHLDGNGRHGNTRLLMSGQASSIADDPHACGAIASGSQANGTRGWLAQTIDHLDQFRRALEVRHEIRFTGSSPRTVRRMFSAMTFARASSIPSVQPDTCGVMSTLRNSWNGWRAGKVGPATVG